MKERKNKKNKSLGGILLMVLMLLSQFAGEDGFIALIILLAMGAVGFLTFVIVKAAKKSAPSVAKKEPCEFGSVNHEYSHDANRRLAQLDGFYKDGLVDRKEYELLKARWSK